MSNYNFNFNFGDNYNYDDDYYNDDYYDYYDDDYYYDDYDYDYADYYYDDYDYDYDYNYNHNHSSSYTSVGVAYGGNAYGGSAYGGTAYGGVAYGGNAYGGVAYGGSAYASSNYISYYSNSYGVSRNFGGYYYGSSYSASISYSATNFYDVGRRNGYLQNYNSRNSVMNFVDLNISYFSRNDSYVSFGMSNGTSFQAQTSSSENEIFQYSTDGYNISYAKLGYQERDNHFTYENGVNYYSGGSRANVLDVTSYESVTVHLDGSAGVLYDNINTIDATSSYGNNELFGNSNNNEIHAGNGNDRLWGGKGGNDLLYGGAGQNTFYYGVHEGNDTIYNSVSSDKISLYNVSLSDIVSAGEVGQDFVVNMASGESLTIKGQNGASNFVLSDQSAYSYSRQSHTWTKTN